MVFFRLRFFFISLISYLDLVFLAITWSLILLSLDYKTFVLPSSFWLVPRLAKRVLVRQAGKFDLVFIGFLVSHRWWTGKKGEFYWISMNSVPGSPTRSSVGRFCAKRDGSFHGCDWPARERKKNWETKGKTRRHPMSPICISDPSLRHWLECAPRIRPWCAFDVGPTGWPPALSFHIVLRFRTKWIFSFLQSSALASERKRLATTELLVFFSIHSFPTNRSTDCFPR